MSNRIIHEVQQGTGPWLRLREGRLTASEAPAALGVSRYVQRDELLRRKHTGIAEEHSAATLGKFAAGHAAEADARPLAEELVGELYPVTVTLDHDELPLLASLDGLTLDEETAWESKLWNEELAAAVRANDLPAHYTVQMDQALLVTGAKRCLFTCTDGTRERFVWCFYERDESKFQALLSGWRQFLADLATYKLPEAASAAPVGRAPETLPALRIEITGAVTASNLPAFKATALAAIRSVNRDLQTDQHFADAEKAVKWCSDVEERIAAAKQHALSQTASIDELLRTMDDISAEARRVRLDLDKLVTARKQQLKEQAIVAVRNALTEHIAALNAEIAPARLALPVADFAGAIKGLKSIDSVRSKLDTALAAAKIEADAQAKAIRANLTEYARTAKEVFGFLFPDLAQLVHKPADDFRNLVEARVAQHKAMEAEKERKRQEAEAERVRQEEAARVAAASAAQQAAQVPAQAHAAAPAYAPVELAAVQSVAPVALPARTDEPATLKLGTICEELGITMTAQFLAETLRIPHRGTQDAAKLYRESDFERICFRLQEHVETKRLARREKVAA